ncbi:MAG: branched-chain amino acid transport system permease protein [Solirubrobacteraceae bacterium]
MVQIVIDSVIRGCALAVLAAAVTLVYGLARFANIAQVELATVAAYVTFGVGTLGLALVPAALVGVACAAALAVLSYVVLFRRMLADSTAKAMIASLALGIVIRAALQFVAGPEPRRLNLPLEQALDVRGALVTPSQMRATVTGLAVLALLLAVLRWTPLGRSIRAVAINRDLASAAGIASTRVTAVVWALAGMLSGLGGVMLAVTSDVGIQLGYATLLPVFAAAILGGLGSPGGAIVAAFGLSLVEGVVLDVDWGKLVGSTEWLVPTPYRPAIGFVALVIVLVVRPQGLFGRDARRA